MFRIFPLLLALTLVASFALASAAPAEESDGRLTAHSLLTRSRVVGDPGHRPSAIQPVQGIHAQAFPLARLGVWAQGHGFTITRRAALYDLEGGASLRLQEGVRVTASYRMLGIDLGFDSDVEGADGEPGIAAPFLGLAFDF